MSGAGGSAGDAGPKDALAPDVELLTPGELTNPNAGAGDNVVLVASTVTARCKVTKSTHPSALDVDRASVKIRMEHGAGADAGANVKEEDGAPVADAPGEYSADFILTTVPTGPVSFSCSASDSTKPTARTNTDTHSTFVDHGPLITVTQPKATDFRKVKGEVPFEFKVEPVLLVAAGDTGAALGPVRLNVHGMPITNLQTAADGTYSTSVNFETFPNIPNGPVSVIIDATNQRTPIPVTKTERYQFVVDGNGPTINITSHKEFRVVNGSIVLAFTVADLVSGINENSVEITWGTMGEFKSSYSAMDPNWSWDKNTQTGSFTFKFDSRNVTTARTQFTVNITAEDKAGNLSTFGEGTLILYIDGQPPTVDLDPGNVREFKIINPTTNECSESFDPLGTDPPNDLETVGVNRRFRALVWDETNEEQGATRYYAQTNPDSVFIYIQPNVNTPLLIDTNKNDGSNKCDDLADTGLQSKKLQGYDQVGDPNLGTATIADPPALAGCTTGTAPARARVCTNQGDGALTRVIKHAMRATPTERVVYGIGTSAIDCVGGFWEFGTLLPEGWICMAGRAIDKVGNVGISPPLRVCLDKNDGGENPCTGAPPSCTDGCVPPVGFDAQLIVR